MKILAIDIETYSSVSLPDCGVYVYAESSDFEILLFGYARDDEPAQTVDFTACETLPEDILTALYDPAIIKTAFNANFERTCLSAWFKHEFPPEEWLDTAVTARELSLPGSLADVGAVIGLPEDKQKSKAGKALIRYFSIPCKATKVNGQRTRNLPSHDPDRWALYKEYNTQDVEAERAIRKKLEKFSVKPSEYQLWYLDQRINDRGVMADLDFAGMAVTLDEQIKADLLADAKELTGLENPKSPAQLKAWIEEQSGVEVESLRKDKIKDVKSAIDNDDVHQMLEIRAGLSKTSNSKYAAILRTAGSDSRIRGLTLFYGAGRTGRWAGRMVQMQNLPQNKMPDRDLDIARSLIKAGHFKAADMLFDNVPGVLSQLIRTAFVPKPGHRFIVADFSAIEARVIAWLADELWRMEVFNTHGKIYEASAERMFNLPAGSVGKGDPIRQKGKIAELALGYGGSVGALKSMGALDMGLTEEELKPLVDSWRRANRNITSLWWSVDAAVKRIIQTKTKENLQHGIKLFMEGPLMRLQLPSGRALSYVKPRIVDDQICYEGVQQFSGKWDLVESYGPKFVENIVQAASRDCLAEKMIHLEAAGFPVVFHVHDEVILEVPIGQSSTKEIDEIMSQEIPWAVGLPLNSSAYECDYYRKD